MNLKLYVSILLSIILIGSISSTLLTDQAYSQIATNSNNQTGKLMNLSPQEKLKEIDRISSLTNVVGISLVEGIKLSGINIGNTDMSVTLKSYSPVTGNKSLPVTVIVSKLPVANLTQLISLVESSKAVATTSGGPASSGSLLGQSDLTSVMGNNALSLLMLLKSLQIGAASIVSGDWSQPQTVSMGMLGSLLNPASSTESNEFITVIIVPFIGETSFPSVSFN
jgi:hypothetical protein